MTAFNSIHEASIAMKEAGASTLPDFDTAETYDHADDGIVIASEHLSDWIANRPVTPAMFGEVAKFDERDKSARPYRGRVIYVAEVMVGGEIKTASVIETW